MTGLVDHCTHIQRHVLSPSVPIGKAVALENLHPVGADPEHCLRSMLRSIEHVRRFTLVHQAEKASVESFAPTMVQIGENLAYIGNKHHHAEDRRVCHDSCRDAPQHVCHRIVKAAVPGCKSCVVVSMLDSRQSAIVDRLGIVLLLSSLPQTCTSHPVPRHGSRSLPMYVSTHVPVPPRETVPSLLCRWGPTTTSRAVPHRSSSDEPCVLRLFSPVPDAGALYR